MTEHVRRSGAAPPGATVEPVEASPEQRIGEWRGELSGEAGTAPDVEVDELDAAGIDPGDLSDDDLIRELHSLHRTRLDTLRHAADTALATHLRRTADLETEYLTRYPGREIDPGRLRDGD